MRRAAERVMAMEDRTAKWAPCLTGGEWRRGRGVSRETTVILVDVFQLFTYGETRFENVTLSAFV